MIFEALSWYVESLSAFWVSMASGGLFKLMMIACFIYWICCRRRRRRWRWRWHRFGCGCHGGPCGCSGCGCPHCDCVCGGCACRKDDDGAEVHVEEEVEVHAAEDAQD